MIHDELARILTDHRRWLDEERYRRENIAKLIQIERSAKARIRRAHRAK